MAIISFSLDISCNIRARAVSWPSYALNPYQQLVVEQTDIKNPFVSLNYEVLDRWIWNLFHAWGRLSMGSIGDWMLD